MENFNETVAQIVDLMGDIEKKLVDMDSKARIAEKKLELIEKLSKRIDSVEQDLAVQKNNVLEKIDTISSQIKELKTLVYEAGLIVVGPDRIEKLQGGIGDKKTKAAEPKKKKSSAKKKK